MKEGGFHYIPWLKQVVFPSLRVDLPRVRDVIPKHRREYIAMRKVIVAGINRLKSATSLISKTAENFASGNITREGWSRFIQKQHSKFIKLYAQVREKITVARQFAKHNLTFERLLSDRFEENIAKMTADSEVDSLFGGL